MRTSTPRPINSARVTATLLCSTLLLSSCAVGPDYKRPGMHMPAAFKEAPAPVNADFIGPMPQNAQNPKSPIAKADFVGPMPQKAQDVSKQLVKATPKDEADRGKWWAVFNDAELNKLEEQVNINNQNIKLAEANFRQARALVAEAQSAFFPDPWRQRLDGPQWHRRRSRQLIRKHAGRHHPQHV